MKLNVPEIKHAIQLADYAAEFGEETIDVRVNPPRGLLVEWDALMQRARNGEKSAEIADRINAILAELWSWQPEEVAELAAGTLETDPALFGWLIGKTFEAIRDHRAGIKKN